MTQCPEIEALLARQASARAHAAGCGACAAVLSLCELRDERGSSRGDACVEAEVLLALGGEGLLDAEQDRALAAHLESCADCNEVAVRVAANGGAADGDVVPAALEKPGSSRVRWGLWLGFAASLAAAAALGALATRAKERAEERPVAELPRAEERALPVAPAPPLPLEPEVGAAPVSPPSVPAVPRPPEPLELLDPWAAGKGKAPGTSRPPPAGSGPGFLTILCVPTCDVVLAGGKNLGPSPVVRAPLPAGPVNVELRRGSVKRFIRVQIVADQVAARRISMVEERDTVVDPWR